MLLPVGPASAGTARELVRTRCGLLTESARDAAVLLASEVVTNALRHARPPIDLTIDCDRRGVRITVADGHVDRPVPRPLSPEEASGRGVHLIDALASAWGVQDRPAGKAVWFYVNHEVNHEVGPLSRTAPTNAGTRP